MGDYIGGISCAFCGTASVLHTGESETVSRFIVHLGVQVEEGLSSQAPSLCEECYAVVVKALEWREQLGEVERDVRSLQRIILKMMRQLTSLQSSYLGEMRKLEGKIRTTQGQGNKRRDSQEMGAIRDGIANVVEELGLFMESTSSCSLSTDSRNVNDSPPPEPLQQSSAPPEVQPADPIFKSEPLPPPPDEEIDIEHLIPVKLEPPADPLTEDPLTTEERKRPMGQKRPRRPCPICGQFYNPRYLRAHIRTHNEERPFLCSHCPQTFATRRYLQNHERTHDIVPRFQCPYCPLAFRQRHGLHGHKKRQHNQTTLINRKKKNNKN